MKDFMKKYHNKKVIWNIWIWLASLVLAFWINIFIIDDTNIGDSLKASISETKIENKADVYVDNKNNVISIKNSKDIKSVETLSLSISYNPSNVVINWYESKYWEVIVLWEENTWIDTIILKSWNIDILKSSELLKITLDKNEDKSEQLNLINVNFKDNSGEKYNLSTSWITF